MGSKYILCSITDEFCLFDIILILILFICRYYEATVDSVDNDEVSVLFDNHKLGIPVVLTQEFLKELPKGQDRGAPKIRFVIKFLFYFFESFFW